MSSSEGSVLGKKIKESIFGFDPFDLHDFVFDWMAEWGVSRGLTLLILFIGLLTVLSMEIPNLAIFTLAWLAGTAPVWLPVVLWIAAWKAWVNYIQSLFLSTRHPIVLEVKIPREITKSPRAMEVVFSNLYFNTGETTSVHRGWRGSVRPWLSFEMASFGGDVHFYVWCFKAYKGIVEASIYSQYPEVEIVEVPDYISTFRYDPKKHNCFGGDYIYFGHKAAHGELADEYPIKSYIDYELEKDPDEENKVDPFATVIEALSALKPNESAWVQMNIRMFGSEGVLIRKKNDWVDRVKKQVEKLRVEAATFDDATVHTLSEQQARSARPRGTWRHTYMMETMERHLSKQYFEIGMRHLYIAEGAMDGVSYTSMRWLYKPFNAPGLFNFIRSRRWHNDFDFPWQDIGGYRWELWTRRMIDAMRRRSYFYTPWKTPHLTMSTEMMATLYHYPSSGAKAPGLQRISAKKVEAPHNLPR